MGKSARILVVDDDPESTLAMCALLEGMGHICRHVPKRAPVLEVLRSVGPDLALLDITVPDIGLDIARVIRRHAPRQPYLVAMTRWNHPDHRELALAAGFDAHVVRPVNTATLERLVRAVPSSRPTAPMLAIVR